MTSFSIYPSLQSWPKTFFFSTSEVSDHTKPEPFKSMLVRLHLVIQKEIGCFEILTDFTTEWGKSVAVIHCKNVGYALKPGTCNNGCLCVWLNWTGVFPWVRGPMSRWQSAGLRPR